MDMNAYREGHRDTSHVRSFCKTEPCTRFHIHWAHIIETESQYECCYHLHGVLDGQQVVNVFTVRFFKNANPQLDLSDIDVVDELYKLSNAVFDQGRESMMAEFWPKLMAAQKEEQPEKRLFTIEHPVRLAPVVEPAKAQEEQCCSVVEARAHL